MWVSKPLFWTPLYVAMIWACVQRLRWRKQLALFALCTGFCGTGTDVVSARVLKPSVARLRPSHEPALANAVHLVEERPELYRGGRHGFVSSHAANHGHRRVVWGISGGVWGWVARVGRVDWLQPHPPRRPTPVTSSADSSWAGCWRCCTDPARRWTPEPLNPNLQAMAEGITAMTWVAVFLGGGVGSVLRFGLGQGALTAEAATFPWAVLGANVPATALLAWCAVAGAELWGKTSPVWFFMTVGLWSGSAPFPRLRGTRCVCGRMVDGRCRDQRLPVLGCVVVGWWVARVCADS